MNALKKVTTRAKAVRKAHPNMSWKNALKHAGLELRNEKRKKSPGGSKARKTRRPGVKRAAPNKGTKPGGTPSPVSALKSGLKEKLGRLLLKKELARTKRDKRKAQKEISIARRSLRIAEKL